MSNNLCPDCGKYFEIGDWPFACAGMGHTPGSFWSGDAAFGTGEKVVVYESPTGEIRIPGRGDRPIHPKYAAEGYVRKELSSVPEIRQVEKRTGLIPERSNYDMNSAKAERDTNST